MSTYCPNARRSLYLWALVAMVIFGGCSRRVSRTYEGASLMGRYTMKIGEIRQEKGYVYNSTSATIGEAGQDMLRLDAPGRFGEAAPVGNDPLDVVRESLITQAEGTGLFKQVGVELSSPDYVLWGNVRLLSSSYSDSLGTHLSYRAVLRAYLEDIQDGAMIWSGEGIGAEPLQVEYVVETSLSDSRESLAHHAPWLFEWSPEAILEAAQEVMKQAAEAIVERELGRARELP